MKNYDDKDLVIVATLIIAIISMVIPPFSPTLAGQVVAGMFGLAIGKRI